MECMMSAIKFGVTYKKPDPAWDYGHGLGAPKYAAYHLAHAVVPCLYITWAPGRSFGGTLFFRMFTADRVVRSHYVQALRAGVHDWDAGNTYPACLADHLARCTDTYAFFTRTYAPSLTVRWQEYTVDGARDYCEYRLSLGEPTPRELADKHAAHAAFASFLHKHADDKAGPGPAYAALHIAGFQDVQAFDDHTTDVYTWRAAGPRMVFLTDPAGAVS